MFEKIILVSIATKKVRDKRIEQFILQISNLSNKIRTLKYLPPVQAVIQWTPLYVCQNLRQGLVVFPHPKGGNVFAIGFVGVTLGIQLRTIVLSVASPRLLLTNTVDNHFRVSTEHILNFNMNHRCLNMFSRRERIPINPKLQGNLKVRIKDQPEHDFKYPKKVLSRNWPYIYDLIHAFETILIRS